ncbi:hypothetical protein C498_17815 [Haloferax volcanii DS2]|uniref:Uncharacterized protein n=1 Tax=Haloferax volcanii (strain ATCC 29605 / DSM 3757 / JCM 8879 / NBRC 14742 / NCIMB 2012 / VKM B-1768 / DS2) TaxID=309800 RepID=A0A384LCD5_HALVD|nr:hypothetical protein C498_17815 [Haloferax volcanii DS2]
MFTLTGVRVVDADGTREANVVIDESTGRIASVGDETEGETGHCSVRWSRRDSSTPTFTS